MAGPATIIRIRFRIECTLQNCYNYYSFGAVGGGEDDVVAGKVVGVVIVKIVGYICFPP